MLLDMLVHDIWLTLGVWTALYASDYALTLLTARLLNAGGGRGVALEKDIELTLIFQQDVRAQRWLSPRPIIVLLALDGYLWYLWQSLVREGAALAAFEAVMGALFLLEVVIHLRHFRNLAFLLHAWRSDGLQGVRGCARWLSYRLSMFELFAFAVLYALFFGLTGRWFFVGGAITTLLSALSHARFARKPRLAPVPSQPPPASDSEEGQD